MARSREKIFHYLFAVTLLVGSIAYYAMASDLAWDVISQVNETQNGTRQIFFAKYVYWVVSFPVVTIALGLVSGISCEYIETVFLLLSANGEGHCRFTQEATRSAIACVEGTRDQVLTIHRGEHPLQRHPLLGLGPFILVHRLHGVDV